MITVPNISMSIDHQFDGADRKIKTNITGFVQMYGTYISGEDQA
jgi:hypothetical protein